MLSKRKQSEGWTLNMQIKALHLNTMLLPPGIPPFQNLYKNERLKYICDNIIDDYDILLFTEVFGNYKFTKFMEFHPSFSRVKYLKRRAAEKGYKYSLRQGDESKSYIIDGGLMILSRYPIDKAYGIIFKKSRGLEKFSCKGALYAQIKGINIFFTHLASDSTLMGNVDIGSGDNIRKQQIIEFNNFIKHHSDNKKLSVIVGDMNVIATREKQYEYLIKILNVKDIFYEKYGYHIPTYKYKNHILRYDYVFQHLPYNLNSYIKNVGIKKFQTPDEPFPQISTHYGLEFEIKI